MLLSCTSSVNLCKQCCDALAQYGDSRNTQHVRLPGGGPVTMEGMADGMSDAAAWTPGEAQPLKYTPGKVLRLGPDTGQINQCTGPAKQFNRESLHVKCKDKRLLPFSNKIREPSCMVYCCLPVVTASSAPHSSGRNAVWFQCLSGS